MLEKTLPANPSNLLLATCWAIILVFVLGGLLMVFWPEKRLPLNDEEKETRPNRQSTGMKINVGKHVLISGVRIKGFDNALDMKVGEDAYVTNVDAEAPQKKKE